jgi:Carboxypeptidase regulatory-like domain
VTASSAGRAYLFDWSFLTRTVFCPLILVLLALVAPAGWTQVGGTGALSVTVTDTNGGAIPNAAVHVENAAGVSRTQSTDAGGVVTFAQLPPGIYTVTIAAAAAGFEKAVVQSVEVYTTQTNALTQTLKVGAEQQVVTVSAAPPALQTESATLGGVVNETSIESIPLVTRDYTQILNLSPGVVTQVNSAATLGRGSSVVFTNGLDNRSTDYMLDGIWTPEGESEAEEPSGFWGNIPMPNPDALQEFMVQTANYDASYGRAAGSIINVETKSGSNELHGSLFEFNRNNIFNANDFFLAPGAQKAEMKQNQFGGTIGGPLIREKLFGFLAYQGTRQINGLSTYSTSTVIEPLGLDSLGTNRTAAALGATFCPSNTTTGISTYAAVTGVANPSTDQVACDGSNISPVAIAELNSKLPDGNYTIPVPQGVKNGESYSTYSVPSTYNEDQLWTSLDYVVSQKSRLALDWFYARAPMDSSFSMQSQGPGVGFTNLHDNNLEIARLTTAISTKVVNEARFASSYAGSVSISNYKITATSLGTVDPVSTSTHAPEVSITNLGLTWGGFISDDSFTPQTTYTWGDTVSLVHGPHSIKFGFDEEFLQNRVCAAGRSRGTLTFQTFADFLLGMSAAENGTSLSNIFTSSGGTQSCSVPERMHDNFVSGYVQDDYQVNRKLTLNLGLRWEYDGIPYDTETYNGESIGGTVPVWPLYEAIPVPPANGTYVGLTVSKSFNYDLPLPVGITRRNSESQSWGLQPLDHFAPRIGFAFTPFSKVVLRGGYGQFYDVTMAEQALGGADGNPPNGEAFTRSGTANALATWANPYNPSVTWGSFNDFLRTPTSVLSPLGDDPTFRTPTVYAWNMDLEYAVKPSWIVDVAYVGNRAPKIPVTATFNIPALASATNPVNCDAPFGCITTNTAANSAERVPVLGISAGGFTLAQTNAADSHYEAVQAQLRKVLSHGLQLDVSYTFGRCISDLYLSSGTGGIASASGPTTGFTYDVGLGKPPASDCGYYPPQRLVVNYTYSAPDVHSDHGLVGKALSGWGASGVTTYQSGFPLSFTDTRAGTAFGSIQPAGANLCPGMTIANIRTPGSIANNVTHFFNKNAFCAPPLAGAAGSGTLYGNLAPDIMLGPPESDWDIAILKNTAIGGLSEKGSLQFRTEFFNAFNHPVFAAPGTVANSSSFGVFSSTINAPRIIQFGLKYLF